MDAQTFHPCERVPNKPVKTFVEYSSEDVDVLFNNKSLQIEYSKESQRSKLQRGSSGAPGKPV